VVYTVQVQVFVDHTHMYAELRPGSPIVKAVEMLEGLQAGPGMRLVMASWFGALFTGTYY
jgi:hypothetical protein